MRAALGSQQAIRISTTHGEVGRQDSCLCALRDISDFNLKSLAFRPPRKHSQEHFAPILGINTAVFGIDLHDCVCLVMHARKQTA